MIARYTTRDERTTHERYCDYEIAKASTKRPYRGGMKLGRNPQSKRYSNYELREMFKKVLTDN